MIPIEPFSVPVVDVGSSIAAGRPGKRAHGKPSRPLGAATALLRPGVANPGRQSSEQAPAARLARHSERRGSGRVSHAGGVSLLL